MGQVLLIKRGGGLQELAGVFDHGTPQMREIFGLLLGERLILGPELRNPAIDVNGRIVRVEVIEVILGEGLLGTVPHQAVNPRDEDVADGVGIDGINLRLVPDLIGLL